MSEQTYWIPEEKRGGDQLFAELPELPPQRKQRRGGRRRWIWLLLLLGLVAGLFLLRRPLLVAGGSFLDVSQSIRPANYVLVLSGNPEQSPFYAAALYRAGLAGSILLTQPTPAPDVLDGILPPEEELAEQILLRQGVFPIDVVHLPGEVRGVADEVRAFVAYLKQHPSAHATVVTVAHRTRRVRRIVRSQLDEGAVGRVRILGVPADAFGPDDWWHSPNGTVAYLGELVKVAVQPLID